MMNSAEIFFTFNQLNIERPILPFTNGKRGVKKTPRSNVLRINLKEDKSQFLENITDSKLS